MNMKNIFILLICFSYSGYSDNKILEQKNNKFKNDFGRFDYSKTFDFESFDLNKSKAETYHRNLFWPHD